MYWVGSGISGRCPPYIRAPCKICKFARKGNVIPKVSCFFGFSDVSGKGCLYDIRAMHGKMYMISRSTKSNCPFVSNSLNNIK